MIIIKWLKKKVMYYFSHLQKGLQYVYQQNLNPIENHKIENLKLF